MDQETSDETLMLQYRDGNAGAFEVLYQRHKGPVFRYLLRQCGERGIAEELFQDAWMSLIRNRDHYTVQAKFTTYLYQIAHHRLLDHYRRQSHTVVAMSFNQNEPDNPIVDQVPDDPGNEPERQINLKQQAEKLATLIDNLPAPQREAFLLHEEADLGIEDIAAATGVNRETAKSRLRYAIAKLRAELMETP
jgi:RNA polymerase sigma factor (sigma-70 family)